MNKGFTFIEVLITITLMMIIMGLGIAAFDRFNERQRVVEAALSVQNLMRSAQIKARSGDKPTGCTRLESYRMTLTANSPSVTLSAVCSGPTTTIVRETYTMPSGIVSEANLSADFYVLRGGSNVSPITPIVVKSSNNMWRYGFTASPGGAVDEGDFL